MKRNVRRRNKLGRRAMKRKRRKQVSLTNREVGDKMRKLYEREKRMKCNEGEKGDKIEEISSKLRTQKTGGSREGGARTERKDLNNANEKEDEYEKTEGRNGRRKGRKFYISERREDRKAR